MKTPTGKPEAMACVSGEGRLRGIVKFYAAACGSLVVAEIRGLPESDTGFFAFHIHEGSDCGGADFADTGGHFNPGKQEHPRHAGDLPPLLSKNGTALLEVETARFTPKDVIGRTVVIHEHPDDFHTQPAGNAGRKIACGVIRKV
ncbi:MAG: superoxide dismutase family protein [Faecousia sp.]